MTDAQRKVAVITGGSQGLGLAVARRLAAAEVDLAVCARGPEQLASAADELRALGARVLAEQADVTVPEDLDRFVDHAAKQLGRVDLLVANAGGAPGGSLLESTPAQWREAFELNVLHAANAVRSCVPHMRRAGGGAVVIVSSISGWKPAPRAQYGSAKAAEIYLAGSLAWELAADSIRINTVSPGSLLIPGGGWEQLRHTKPEVFTEFERRQFPAGRLTTAEEVAEVVAFLLSDAARGVNGANIPVDGGQADPSAFGY